LSGLKDQQDNPPYPAISFNPANIQIKSSLSGFPGLKDQQDNTLNNRHNPANHSILEILLQIILAAIILQIIQPGKS
jgi:hypothetical protein